MRPQLGCAEHSAKEWAGTHLGELWWSCKKAALNFVTVWQLAVCSAVAIPPCLGCYELWTRGLEPLMKWFFTCPSSRVLHMPCISVSHLPQQLQLEKHRLDLSLKALSRECGFVIVQSQHVSSQLLSRSPLFLLSYNLHALHLHRGNHPLQVSHPQQQVVLKGRC